MYTNSLDKIVYSYLAAVCSRPFTYECDGRFDLIRVKPLTVSPTIFRGYTCPPQCGACCQRFSLVYLPNEKHPYPLQPFEARFDGRPALLFHDPQATGGRYCRNLSVDGQGRCGIHGLHPFTCDFELIRVHMSTTRVRMGLQLYGRAWQMKRVDGARGARCAITPANEETKADTIRKMSRLFQWSTHLGVETHIPAIIDWLRRGPHEEPLRL